MGVAELVEDGHAHGLAVGEGADDGEVVQVRRFGYEVVYCVWRVIGRKASIHDGLIS
jgi:hypothetical protein